MAESATKGTRETAVLRAAEKSSVAFLVFEFEPKSFDFILLFLSFLRFLGDVKADGAAYRYKGFLFERSLVLYFGLFFKPVIQNFKATRVEPWSFLKVCFLRASSRFYGIGLFCFLK